MRTWMHEVMLVASILFVSAEMTGGTWPNRLAAVALVFTFMHAQVSDRMAEQQERSPEQIACFRRASQYWVVKEGLWIAVFVMAELWTAIVGAVIFLLYPFWRKLYRRQYPLDRPDCAYCADTGLVDAFDHASGHSQVPCECTKEEIS